jgi:hypothetical protein
MVQQDRPPVALSNPWIGKNMLQEFVDVNNPCGDGAGGAAARGRRGGQAPWQTGPAAGDE